MTTFVVYFILGCVMVLSLLGAILLGVLIHNCISFLWLKHVERTNKIFLMNNKSEQVRVVCFGGYPRRFKESYIDEKGEEHVTCESTYRSPEETIEKQREVANLEKIPLYPYSTFIGQEADVNPYTGIPDESEESEEEIVARQEAELERAEQEAYEQAGYPDVEDSLLEREEE